MTRSLILGGGIGGLSCSIALHQAGIPSVVYEQADELRPVGAGLMLWANAIKALRTLGLADAVIAAGSRINLAAIRTAGGRTLSSSRPGELEQRFGEPTIAIHRGDLQRILLAALPEGTVRLDARGLNFDQEERTVTVRFADGRTDRGDLLIGADGIHSVVREQLFPDVNLRYSGYTAWRGVVETTDEAALGLTVETWGQGSRFGMLRIDDERVYWFATANTPAGLNQPPAEAKRFLQERFAGWHHPIGLLLESTPAEAIIRNDIHDLPPMKQWGKGRVVLLGDAAHPTTPNMGQGACMAIESSVILARCLAEGPTLSDAIRRYEIRRMPRTAWITEQSRRIGYVGQLENPLACTLRDFVTRITPSKVVVKTLEKAVGYEL